MVGLPLDLTLHLPLPEVADLKVARVVAVDLLTPLHPALFLVDPEVAFALERASIRDLTAQTHPAPDGSASLALVMSGR